MFLSGSYKDAWRARYQALSPWPATYQEITPYFRTRYLDRVRLFRWRRNADTTFADATTLESGRIRYRMARSICSVILQAASSSFIILYDPTHPRQQKDGDVLKPPLCSHPQVRIPNSIADPSPATFILACLFYAFAAASFHQLHANDQYQNTFLTAGASVAVLLSLAQFGTVKDFMPCAITIALMLSASVHCLYPGWRLKVAEELDGAEGDHMDQEKHTQATTKC